MMKEHYSYWYEDSFRDFGDKSGVHLLELRSCLLFKKKSILINLSQIYLGRLCNPPPIMHLCRDSNSV